MQSKPCISLRPWRYCIICPSFVFFVQMMGVGNAFSPVCIVHMAITDSNFHRLSCHSLSHVLSLPLPLPLSLSLCLSRCLTLYCCLCLSLSFSLPPSPSLPEFPPWWLELHVGKPPTYFPIICWAFYCNGPGPAMESHDGCKLSWGAMLYLRDHIRPWAQGGHRFGVSSPQSCPVLTDRVLFFFCFFFFM